MNDPQLGQVALVMPRMPVATSPAYLPEVFAAVVVPAGSVLPSSAFGRPSVSMMTVLAWHE